MALRRFGELPSFFLDVLGQAHKAHEANQSLNYRNVIAMVDGENSPNSSKRSRTWRYWWRADSSCSVPDQPGFGRMKARAVPELAELKDRLRNLRWLTAVGTQAEFALPFDIRFVVEPAAARTMIEDPAWREWTLERRNDLTSFLNKRFPARYADWNVIAKEVRSLVECDYVPSLTPAIAETIGASEGALDAARWNLAGACMEAAYADCRPPRFFSHLVQVYEAGHIPVGWDAAGRSETLLVY